jgi:hypothetical protein
MDHSANSYEGRYMFFGNVLMQYIHTYIHKKLRGLSPWANYTDRATAACRIEGAMWSAWQIPTAVFSAFSQDY